MPPFRTGLSKRKIDIKDSKLSSVTNSSSEDDVEVGGKQAIVNTITSATCTAWYV